MYLLAEQEEDHHSSSKLEGDIGTSCWDVLLLLLFLLLVLLLQRNRAPSVVLFVSQCCNLATVTVQFFFPFFILCAAQWCVHGSSCYTKSGAPQCCLFCITMLQPVNNAVLFSFPFPSLFFLRHNGACMATQCWHPMLLHSNNAAVCATHWYAWHHNDHLRSHSQLQQEVQHSGLHPAVKPVAQSGGQC